MSRSATGAITESRIAAGFLIRLLMVGPLAVGAAALLAGYRGALSSIFAIFLVGINFLIMLVLFRQGARFGMVGVMTAAFLALLVGLLVLTAATLPLAKAPWMDLPVFGVVVIGGHLSAVLAESRRVSGRLGDGGLRPWKVVR